MSYQEHPLDKYIMTSKLQLQSLPEGSPVMDTSIIQMMCLEKFANMQGYRVEGGLFVTDNPACRVMNLNSMVALYNNTVSFLGDGLKGHAFIERVYFTGRSLRRSVRVMENKIKFL